MTTLQSGPGITIRLSTFKRGGWECWVCNQFTPFECRILTRNGLRWLPCCTVGCYRHLPAAYEKFELGQSQGVSGVLFPRLNEKTVQKEPEPMTWLKRFVRFMRQFRGRGFVDGEE